MTIRFELNIEDYIKYIAKQCKEFVPVLRVIDEKVYFLADARNMPRVFCPIDCMDVNELKIYINNTNKEAVIKTPFDICLMDYDKFADLGSQHVDVDVLMMRMAAAIHELAADSSINCQNIINYHVRKHLCYEYTIEYARALFCQAQVCQNVPSETAH